jgi:hypothetical protein
MAEMNAALWETLEELAAKGFYLDERYNNFSRVNTQAYDTLCDLGYVAYNNTGPGDSIHTYNITEAGKAALTAHQADEGKTDT